MWYFRILILLALAGAFIVVDGARPSLLRAQSNPPFQNPSLDSNCYFPQIGVAGEIDTIVGDSGKGQIGYYIHNLGPQQGGLHGHVLIGNENSIFEQATTGPNFNLHSLQTKAQNVRLGGSEIHYGHLHDSAHLDIFDANDRIIYWADDRGNYDTAHKTNLKTNIGLFHSDDFTQPYIAHLSSDTVDDLVLGTIAFDSTFYSEYLAYFRGGSSLFAQSVAYEDTSHSIPVIPGDYNVYSTMQGDFSGTGRDDLLISDYWGNLFFYKNDPPFLLSNLVHAMQYDTLWAKPSQWDTNIIRDGQEWLYGSLSMHALPKNRGDNSLDWVVMIPTFDRGDAIYIFRGGPAFGSHRITLDSVAYVITPPDLGYQSWPGGFVDAGDMTGTGNHVLYTGGGAGGAAHYFDQNFYVTGQALDNKIDIFYSNCAAGYGDTLTANSDSLEDLLLGNASYGNAGTMWLMYGSKQIPVHLNPQFAEVKTEIEQIPQNNGAGITFAPNPIPHSWSVATIIWPVSEEADLCVYDLLGTAVQTEKIRLLGGPEQQRIYFPNLAAGVYVVELHGASGVARAKLVVVH